MDGIRIISAKDIPEFSPPSTCDLGDPFYGEVAAPQLFAAYPEWKEAREEYQPRPEIIEKLRTIKAARVQVFLGTWCPDSGREIPRFYRIIDQAGLENRLEIRLWAADRKKTLPNNLMREYDIKYVPTFVFERDGKEIGRIVEKPAASSFEEDMWRILGR